MITMASVPQADSEERRALRPDTAAVSLEHGQCGHCGASIYRVKGFDSWVSTQGEKSDCPHQPSGRVAHMAGPITRKNRQTGTQVTVVSAGDLGEPDMPWWTICEDHGELVGHDTKALALSHAAEPAGWCSHCQSNHYGTPSPDWDYDEHGDRQYRG